MSSLSRRATLFLFVVCVLALAPPILAGPTETAEPEPDSTATEEAPRVSILFVGNSLTYANDMPKLVQQLLEDSGYEARVEQIARPNFGLQDHWERRKTRRAIRSGGWDVVVLQQGPSATEGRPSLLEYSKKFAELAREGGAEPALYMVWPSRARFFDFDGVADSYATAAREVEGVLLPVGDAWRIAWELDPDLALYGPDGFHPTPAGSLLAALVIYQGLTGIDPHATLRPPAGDPATPTFRILTEAASRAHSGRSGGD